MTLKNLHDFISSVSLGEHADFFLVEYGLELIIYLIQFTALITREYPATKTLEVLKNCLILEQTEW